MDCNLDYNILLKQRHRHRYTQDHMSIDLNPISNSELSAVRIPSNRAEVLNECTLGIYIL